MRAPEAFIPQLRPRIQNSGVKTTRVVTLRAIAQGVVGKLVTT